MDTQLIDHNYVQVFPTIDECVASKTEYDQPWQVHITNQRKRGNNNTVDALPKKCKQSAGQLQLQNRFEILNEQPINKNATADNEDIDHDSRPAAKEPKTPPIFIPNVQNVKSMIQTIESVISNGEYSYKCINQETVKLLPTSAESYRKIVQKLNDIQVCFHTYQLKQERSYRVVLKNMHYSSDISDIKCCLEELGYQVRNIVNARHFQTKQPLSLFYIDLEPNPKNKEIFKIQYILNAKIIFEPPQKKREIVQCKRCQEYGHTKTYCRHPYKCVKCGKSHDSASCLKPKTTPATCALCDGSHPANYKGCVVYKNLQKKGFPQLREKRLDSMQNKETPTQVTELHPPHTHRNQSYAEATKSNANNSDTSISTTIHTFFERFENILIQQSKQIGSLLNLLTTLITKMK